MGFDNVWEVNPPSGVPSGPALGVNTNTGALYVATPKTGSWTQSGVSGPVIKAARLSYTVTSDDLNINNAFLGSNNTPAGITVIWPTPFADDNYTVTVGVEFDAQANLGTDSGYTPGEVYIKTPSSVTVYMPVTATGTNSSALAGDVIVIHAIAVHD